MTAPATSPATSKWTSEVFWREVLDRLRSEIAERETPDYILYHHGVLDRAYTQKYLAKMRRRLDRIYAAGLPEWRERYEL